MVRFKGLFDRKENDQPFVLGEFRRLGGCWFGPCDLLLVGILFRSDGVDFGELVAALCLAALCLAALCLLGTFCLRPRRVQLVMFYRRRASAGEDESETKEASHHVET